jgi:outer membrane protein OmpA-like peptidoglycan-associated protein
LIAASAQAAAALPPAPAITCDPFVIFFELGSAALSASGEQTIENMVIAARATGPSQLRIEGHADSSGPRSYNLNLSRRRAEAVKTALVAKGVAKDKIATRAHGESAALLGAPDGTPNPQWRLAAICFY